MPVAHGAALPHLRVTGLERPIMLLARCAAGIRPGGDDPDALGPKLATIRAAFFLVSCEEEPGQHLRLLGHLATHVDDSGFLERWLAARGEAELKATLLREERSLTLHVSNGTPTAGWIGRPLQDLDLPESCLVALIRRNGSGIIPRGSTVLQEEDHLTVIGDPKAIRLLAARYGRPAGAAPDRPTPPSS